MMINDDYDDSNNYDQWSSVCRCNHLLLFYHRYCSCYHHYHYHNHYYRSYHNDCSFHYYRCCYYSFCYSLSYFCFRYCLIKIVLQVPFCAVIQIYL